MQIHKHIEKKIEREYFFIKGTIDIDSNYFIEEIKKGFEEKSNNSYKTNVGGSMTSWGFFNDNKNFSTVLKKIINYLDKNIKLGPYVLSESWGFSLSIGEKTNLHAHEPNMWSGVLYLNDCNAPPLEFKEIGEILTPGKGNFAIFSSFLGHETEVNENDSTKFGISFNVKHVLFT